jgi:hypothetical protein
MRKPFGKRCTMHFTRFVSELMACAALPGIMNKATIIRYCIKCRCRENTRTNNHTRCTVKAAGMLDTVEDMIFLTTVRTILTLPDRYEARGTSAHHRGMFRYYGVFVSVSFVLQAENEFLVHRRGEIEFTRLSLKTSGITPARLPCFNHHVIIGNF